jgi:hypothetical protein
VGTAGGGGNSFSFCAEVAGTNKLAPTKNKASAAAVSAGQKCFRSFLFIHQLPYRQCALLALPDHLTRTDGMMVGNIMSERCDCPS